MDKKDVLDIYREQFTFEMDRKKDITACAGENRKTNNFRQEKLSSVVTPLKLAVMSLAVAGSLFILLDLDASSARKVSEISIVELHQAQLKQAEAPEVKP